MNIYTVSLFGHRFIENVCDIEMKLEKTIKEIITSKEYVEFLIGRDGDFDLMASSVIKRIMEHDGQERVSLVLVLPYMKSEYEKNQESFLKYYNNVEICPESSKAHYKSAIQLRNKKMVDRSKLVICCLQHKKGGVYQTICYAQKKGIEIINIAKLPPEE